ncbi:hypothetical protein [Macrococcus capreoli]|uniref:hypothetical protein n=1 Tax=Macrococcus capreoli TaxID=2982690 RepID=UPI003EE774E4
MTALQGTLNFIYGIFFLYLACYYNYFYKSFFKIANRIFCISIGVQLFLNMYPILLNNGLSFYLAKEYSNTLIGNSNAVSFYFGFSLIYEFISKGKFWKFFMIFNTLCLILTLSRGGFLSVAISLIIFIILSLFNKNLIKISTYINFLIAIVIISITLYYTPIGKELFESLQLGFKASSIASRNILHEQAISEIISKPYGNGLVWVNDPHNFILRAFRDLGLLFGIIIILLFIYPMKYFISKNIIIYNNEILAVLLGYLTIIIHSLFEIYYFTSITLFYTIFILVYLNISIRKFENNLKER